MKHTKHTNQNRTTKILIGIVSFMLVITLCAVFFLSKKTDSTAALSPTPVALETETPEPTPEPKEEWEFSDELLASAKAEYVNAKAINPDVQCVLIFQSQLIDGPVVQSVDNSYYLRRDWQTLEYSELGCFFMDYEDDYASSQNLTVYGHYVYESFIADRTLMFTPLEHLRDQANYDANKYLAFVTDTEIRYYQIADVADIALYGDYPPEGMDWMRPNYDAEYLNQFIALMKQQEYYDTGVTIADSDFFVTLQTCTENAGNKRLLVLAKELERKPVES